MEPHTRSRIQLFFSDYTPVTHSERTVLIRPGDPVQHVIFIESGSIDQYDISATGNEIVVNTFLPGAFLPAHAALSPMVSNFFYAATEKVTARHAPVGAVSRFLENEPTVVLDLLHRVYRGTDGLLQRLVHALGGSARTLVLHTLIVLCKRIGTPEEGKLAIKLTHQELASLTGLSRETVTRELRLLEHAGVIHTSYGKITAQSIAELQELLGEAV